MTDVERHDPAQVKAVARAGGMPQWCRSGPVFPGRRVWRRPERAGAGGEGGMRAVSGPVGLPRRGAGTDPVRHRGRADRARTPATTAQPARQQDRAGEAGGGRGVGRRPGGRVDQGAAGRDRPGAAGSGAAGTARGPGVRGQHPHRAALGHQPRQPRHARPVRRKRHDRWHHHTRHDGGDGATGARPPTGSTPGVGEGGHGGHRAPLGPPTSSAPWQGHEQRKDTEPR